VNPRPRWLFHRNVGKALLWTALLLALAVAANVVGIWLLGSIHDWQSWLDAAALAGTGSRRRCVETIDSRGNRRRDCCGSAGNQLANAG